MGAYYNSVSVSFVKQEGNRVAHVLAKFAKSIFDFVVWLEDSPSWVEDLLSFLVSGFN